MRKGTNTRKDYRIWPGVASVCRLASASPLRSAHKVAGRCVSKAARSFRTANKRNTAPGRQSDYSPGSHVPGQSAHELNSHSAIASCASGNTSVGFDSFYVSRWAESWTPRSAGKKRSWMVQTIVLNGRSESDLIIPDRADARCCNP